MENKKVKLNFILFKLSIKVNLNILEKILKKVLPINNKKIIFSNFHGNGYGCNPKYIAEEIIKRRLPYKLIWVVSNKKTMKKDFPKGIELVEQYTPKYYFEFLTSKIWVVNTTLKSLDVKKRKEQIYLQTGHGSFGIKKIGFDDLTITDDKKELIYEEAADLNYFISHSKFETEVYSRGFKYDNDKIYEFGHARNDVFFKDNSELKEKVYSYYNIDKEIKTLLYVPTFRKDGRYDCFDIDYEHLRKILSEKFGGNWKILVRFHPRTKKYIKKFFKTTENIINATDYPDIQELLVANDTAITDYSSCIFDFMLSQKPAFIYAVDMEQFDKDQGCYYSFNETPFPIATNNDELEEKIKNFDYNKYKTDVAEFLSGKGNFENGHAAEKVVDLVEGILSNAKN